MILNNKKIIIIINYIIGIFIGYFLYQKGLNILQIYYYSVFRIIGTTPLIFNNKFIRFLSIPGIIGLGFIILLAFLPLYSKNLNDLNFELTQKIDYIFIGNPKNVEIKDISEDGTQIIKPQENNQSLFLPENNNRTIIFNQKINNPQEKDMFVIKFPNNTIYIGYPGSETKIEKINNKYIINKNNGNAEFYIPNNKSNIQIKTNNTQEQKDKSEFSLGYIINSYESKEKTYIKNQIGGNIIMEPFYQKISKKILNIAYYIRPETYSKNMENYNQYKSFFKREDNINNLENEENRFNLMLEQIQKGKKETQIFNNK